MDLNKQLTDDIKALFRSAAMDNIDESLYKAICDKIHVVKMYYDVDLGGDDRYRNHRTGELVLGTREVNKKLILYDSGKKSGLLKEYKYYFEGFEYVHAFIEFEEGIKEEDIDTSAYDFCADVVYILASRQNMRRMLDHAEMSDVLTGIPNIVYFQKK